MKIASIFKRNLALLLMCVFTMFLVACASTPSGEIEQEASSTPPSADNATEQESANTPTDSMIIEAPEGYPEKPITVIIPFAAGGGSDLLMRPFAQVAAKYMEQPLVLINTAGAGGVIGVTDLKNSDNDGYTMGLVLSGPMSTQPIATPVEYDPINDFEYIGGLVSDPLVVAVNADSGLETLDDLIAAGRTETLLWSCASVGAVGNYFGDAFLLNNDMNGSLIPSSGAAEAVTNLMGNHVDFAVIHPAEVASAYQSGDVKILCIAQSERSELVPDVPTMAELGQTDANYGVFKGLAAPKDTPQEIIDYLNSIVKAVASDPEYVEIMKNTNIYVEYIEPEVLKNTFENDFNRFSELAKELGTM